MPGLQTVPLAPEGRFQGGVCAGGVRMHSLTHVPGNEIMIGPGKLSCTESKLCAHSLGASCVPKVQHGRATPLHESNTLCLTPGNSPVTNPQTHTPTRLQSRSQSTSLFVIDRDRDRKDGREQHLQQLPARSCAHDSWPISSILLMTDKSKS